MLGFVTNLIIIIVSVFSPRQLVILLQKITNLKCPRKIGLYFYISCLEENTKSNKGRGTTRWWTVTLGRVWNRRDFQCISRLVEVGKERSFESTIVRFTKDSTSILRHNHVLNRSTLFTNISDVLLEFSRYCRSGKICLLLKSVPITLFHGGSNDSGIKSQNERPREQCEATSQWLKVHFWEY